MSLFGFDGFSRYRSITEIEDSNWVIATDSGNVALDQTGGQNERGALKFGALDLSESSVYYDLGTFTTVGVPLIIGFWFTFDGFDTTNGSVSDTLIKFNSSTTTRNSLRLYQDGHLVFQRSTVSTTLYDSSDPSDVPDGVAKYLIQGQEYKIEIRGDWVNTTGTLEIRVNDEVWAYFPGTIDLDGTISRIYFCTGSVNDGLAFSISDFYALEEDGTAPSEFLGSSFQVEILRPTGDSATEADFTPSTGINNYALVDDSLRHDADGTYVNSSVNGNIDRYTTTDTLTGQRVIGVNTVAVARHEGSADNFRLTIFENATAGNGATKALTANYVPYEYLTTVNPDTSAPWTVTELEGCEFGVEDLA
jgi:hypothetical protein